MKIVDVSDPYYAKSDSSVIVCTLTLDDGKEYPFAATASDPEPHGQEIWEKLNAGQFGDIAPFVNNP